MDCRDARKILPEHIEGNSPPSQRALIEEHLQSCEQCMLYASEIKKTIQTLQGLDEIEPPAWLTAKVMKKIREEAPPRKRWIERLFFPLHIKLPLEAFAALLITVAAIFIFKNMGLELQKIEVQPQAPVMKSIPAEPEKETQKEERPNNIVQPQLLQKEAKQNDSVTNNRAEEISKSQEKKRSEQILPPPATSPAPVSSAIPSPAPPSAIRHAETGKASGMTAQDEMMQRALPAAPRAKLSAEKKSADIMTLTVTVRALEASKKEIATYIARINREFITIDQSESRIIIAVTIDPADISKFLEHLGTLGTIKEDRQTIPMQSGSFKVIIIKQ